MFFLQHLAVELGDQLGSTDHIQSYPGLSYFVSCTELIKIRMLKQLSLMVLIVTKTRLGESDWGSRESEGG